MTKTPLDFPPIAWPAPPARWTLSPQARRDLIALADPDEIGIGFMLGFRAHHFIARVVRTPNHADQKYPHKGRQRSWAFHWEAAQAAEAEAFKQGLAFVGIVHTHRHGKTKPSTLDWRRPRARDVGAIYHCNSGLVTFFLRGTTQRKGGIIGHVTVPYDAATRAAMARYLPPADLIPGSELEPPIAA